METPTAQLAANLRLAAQRRRTAAHLEPITLEAYIEAVRAAPSIAATAHGRVFAMLAAAGMDGGAAGSTDDAPLRAAFFDGEVFGLERPIADIVEYFRTAAQGHQTARRILLLWGPPGGAKSTIATCLKRGLERWSHTDDGAMYALAGCPMHEEPLHLVPGPLETGGQDLRASVQDYIGVEVTGQLCPLCEHRLARDYDGDFTRFPIERVYCSEQRRVGIGTFAPSDPKSMSVEQLTGGINFKQLEAYGSDDDPRTLDWAGEFSKANRGVLECIEFLKNPKEFLVEFLTLSQERQFKVPKFGFIDADIVLLAHTNETEFRQRMADPTNEALQSRLYTVPVPYNVRVSDEVRIYEKLLAQSRQRFHCDPHAVRAASSIAVMTRLTPYPNLSLVEKLHLYDGREIGDFRLNQVPELQRAASREGLEGIDPRFVIDALSRAVNEAAAVGDGQPCCLTTVMAMRALRSSIERAHQLTDEQKQAHLAQLTEARKEIDRQLKDEVQRSFIPAFADSAQAMLENYLNHCEAYCSKQRLCDPVTGEEVEPDEKLMRRIEEMIGVTDNAKDAFRTGVLMRIGLWLRKGRPLTYRSDDQLGRAIEASLFEEMKDIVRVTVSKRSPDHTHAARLNEVLALLCRDRGYCPVCATQLLDYVGAMLNR
ncbi:MAG: protein prkA [Vicinamibacterales bacterium]